MKVIIGGGDKRGAGNFREFLNRGVVIKGGAEKFTENLHEYITF